MAVKVARLELAADPHFRERFRAEVAAARSVGGFHTAPVVDADPDAAAPWLATAYIPGLTLSALLEAEGPMDEARLRALARRSPRRWRRSTAAAGAPRSQARQRDHGV
ncbi:hypothetical protein SCALM49S_07369 [Streptomyces californicus]